MFMSCWFYVPVFCSKLCFFFFQDNTEAILDCLFVSFSSKYLIGGLLLPCSDQIEIVLHLPGISSLLTILAVYKLISFYIVVAFTQWFYALHVCTNMASVVFQCVTVLSGWTVGIVVRRYILAPVSECLIR